MANDSNNYKFGFIYYNKSDKRIIVPKKYPILGWTLNFAHPISYFIVLITLAIVLFLAKL